MGTVSLDVSLIVKNSSSSMIESGRIVTETHCLILAVVGVNDRLVEGTGSKSSSAV